jgi:hypothetical protein
MMTVNSQLIGDGIGVIRCGMEWEWDTLAVFSMGHDPIIELEAWQDLACDRPMPGNRPLIWVVERNLR